MKVHGNFTLERQLGRGATAQVYLARAATASGSFTQDQPVALKVFHPGIWDREDLKRRALAEFEAISCLEHPNIVRVLAPFWDLDPPAVALEFIDGIPLEEFQGRLPYILPEVAVLVVMEVLSALEHAHAKGVIHRDLKPANILVRRDGHVFVSDFGLAKMTDASRLTLSGTILGSPDFMAPEQARGDVTTPRSDLFAVASILYFLVTGTRPFSRHSPLATLAAVLDCQPEPAQRRNPKLSPGLARLLHKGLSRRPEDRFASAADFQGELRRYLDGLGLADGQFNLKEWVRLPNETGLAAMRRISESLIGLCETRLSAGDADGFLEGVSHLSLVAPESAAIPRLMEQYEQRQKRRGFFGWQGLAAVSGIAAVAAFAGGYSLWPKPQAPAVVESPSASIPVKERVTVAQAAPVDPRMTQVAPPTAPNGVAVPSATARETDAQAGPVRRAAALRRTSDVRFDVDESIQVFWDGDPVDPTRPLKEQPDGYHQLRLEKRGSKPITQRILVKSTEPTVIRVR